MDVSRGTGYKCNIRTKTFPMHRWRLVRHRTTHIATTDDVGKQFKYAHCDNACSLQILDHHTQKIYLISQMSHATVLYFINYINKIFINIFLILMAIICDYSCVKEATNYYLGAFRSLVDVAILSNCW